MGVEVALATIVLVAAGVFYLGFEDSRAADPGFRRDGVLLAAYDLSGTGRDSSAVRAFTTSLFSRLRAVPGVEAAAIASSVPLDIHGLPGTRFALEGRVRDDAASDEAVFNIVTPGYFAAMGIPLLQGHDFAELDDRATGPQTIVNQAFVDRYRQGNNWEPLGRQLVVNGRSYAIAGVVRTSVSDAFGEPPTPALYFSLRDRLAARGEIHLRTGAGREEGLATEIRRVIGELDPMLPVFDVRTLNEHVDRNLFLKRIPARMFVVLGPLILLLAAIGIYAVVAYAVEQRTGEIGIRMALGATGSRIVRQVIGESMQVIGFGVAAGAIVALTVGGRLSSSGTVPVAVTVGVPLLIFAVGTLSCWWPARRASRVEALEALRSE